MPMLRIILLLAMVVVGTRESRTMGIPSRIEDPVRTTADGVYTRQQADAGRDLFLYACQSCHAPTQHAGPAFLAKWSGQPLAELFTYMRREMPQTDPGTLSDTEYAALTAYILRINRMPTGPTPLAADSTALHRIRIDTVPSPPMRPDARR